MDIENLINESADSQFERATDDLIFESQQLLNEATATGTVVSSKMSAFQKKIEDYRENMEKAAIDRKIKMGPKLAILLDTFVKLVPVSQGASIPVLGLSLINPLLGLVASYLATFLIWQRQIGNVTDKVFNKQKRSADLTSNLKYIDSIKSSLVKLEASTQDPKARAKVVRQISNADKTKAILEKRLSKISVGTVTESAGQLDENWEVIE